MIYLLLLVVAIIHIIINIREGFTTKLTDKKRQDKFIKTILMSSLFAAAATAFVWTIAPLAWHHKAWKVKLIFLFIPAYAFIAMVCVAIGAYFKMLSDKPSSKKKKKRK